MPSPLLALAERSGVAVAHVNDEEIGAQEHHDQHGTFETEHAHREGVQNNVEDAVEVGERHDRADEEFDDEGEGPRMPYAGIEVQNGVIRGVRPPVIVDLG